MSTSSDVKIANALDVITVGLQNGDDIDPLIAQAGASQSEIEDFVDIIQSLHWTMTPRQPGEEYSERLRADLLAGNPGMVKRLRQMPARVHIAAIVALFAGCLLLMLRRLFGSDSTQEIQEEAVATSL